jgi:hypothetical protein
MTRRLWFAVAVVAVVGAQVVGVASAAPTPVLASPGATPFAGCATDFVAEQQAAGSTLYPNSEIEPRSARFGRNVVAEYQQDRWSDGGARGLVVSVSHDDGVSWHRVVVPGITACSGGSYLRASDPWVSFAPNGDLYAISLSFLTHDVPARNAILVSKSTDFGDTWSDPVALTADDTNGLDKESITADPTNSNYVYAAWDRLVGPGGSLHASDTGLFNARSYKSQTFFARSTDGGAHWGAPQQIFIDSSFSGSIGSIVRVLGNGTTLLDGLVTYGSAAWKGGTCGSISVLRSTDRGASWTNKPIIVSPLSCTYAGAHDPDTGAAVRSGGLLDLVVDGTRASAVWEDALPSAPTTGRILFAQSTDGGLTWSSPVVISDTPAGVDAFIPDIEVNASHNLGVSYYDFRNNTPGGAADTDVWLVRCSSACTSPANWTETRVTPTSFDMHQAPVARGEFVGDYQGITTNGDTFEPFFIQAVTAPTNPTDAYFASVP